MENMDIIYYRNQDSICMKTFLKRIVKSNRKFKYIKVKPFWWKYYKYQTKIVNQSI